MCASPTAGSGQNEPRKSKKRTDGNFRWSARSTGAPSPIPVNIATEPHIPGSPQAANSRYSTATADIPVITTSASRRGNPSSLASSRLATRTGVLCSTHLTTER